MIRCNPIVWMKVVHVDSLANPAETVGQLHKRREEERLQEQLARGKDAVSAASRNSWNGGHAAVSPGNCRCSLCW